MECMQKASNVKLAIANMQIVQIQLKFNKLETKKAMLLWLVVAVAAACRPQHAQHEQQSGQVFRQMTPFLQECFSGGCRSTLKTNFQMAA